MIVLDSGLGAFPSCARCARAPGLPLVYIADTAGFPYGKRRGAEITERAGQMVGLATQAHAAQTVILACNTLSTLSLEALRAQFPFRFVGTVPAVKVAAQQSVTRRFTLLATPNTIDSAYSTGLIAQFAADCVVDRYGAPNLAAMAERALLGEPIDPAALRAELAPAFHDDARGKTDAMVLGCTHYPLIADALRDVAPWPVSWIDSGDAIARRALSQADSAPARSIAYVTAETDIARYRAFFQAEGFDAVAALVW